MKKRLLIIACIAVFLISSLVLFRTITPSNDETVAVQENKDMNQVKISFDYPKYDTFEDLSSKADMIIEGKVVNIEYRMINTFMKQETDNKSLNPNGDIDESKDPYTVFTIEVSKIYKGEVGKKETIEVKQPGGIFEDTEYLNQDSINLEKGTKYVLFLECYEGFPSSLLNPLQASYNVDSNDKVIIEKSSGIDFNMNDLNDLTKQK